MQSYRVTSSRRMEKLCPNEQSVRKRINNDVTHSKSLSSANDFPKIPEKHQSKSSLVTKTLPILLLHKNILCSMASRTFPPLFLFFSLRIIMSALKKIEKDEAVLLYLCFPSVNDFLGCMFQRLSKRINS